MITLSWGWLTGEVYAGLDDGITSMKKGELALFTLPAVAAAESGGIPQHSNSVVQFEVELLSWIKVVDICKDGGIIKKIMEKGKGNERPGDLDEVLGIILTPAYA